MELVRELLPREEKKKEKKFFCLLFNETPEVETLFMRKILVFWEMLVGWG